MEFHRHTAAMAHGHLMIRVPQKCRQSLMIPLNITKYILMMEAIAASRLEAIATRSSASFT